MILRSRARESSAARTVFLYGTLWLLIKPQGVFFVFLGGCCPRRTPGACAPGTEQVARAGRPHPLGRKGRNAQMMCGRGQAAGPTWAQNMWRVRRDDTHRASIPTFRHPPFPSVKIRYPPFPLKSVEKKSKYFQKRLAIRKNPVILTPAPQFKRRETKSSLTTK